MKNSIQMNANQASNAANVICILTDEGNIKEVTTALLHEGISPEHITPDAFDPNSALYVKLNIDNVYRCDQICSLRELNSFPMFLSGSTEEESQCGEIYALQCKVQSIVDKHPAILKDHLLFSKRLEYLKTRSSQERNILLQDNNDFLLSNLLTDLSATYGKEMFGISLPSVPEINTELRGLRDLFLLSSGPNCGKTALMIQLAMDSLESNDDCCVVFISLEMSVATIFERMFRYKAQTNWDAMHIRGEGDLEGAAKFMRSVANRLFIYGNDKCSTLTAETLIQTIHKAKATSGCKRVFIGIDYLQVWPMPTGMADLEGDKWLIAQMQRISWTFPTDAMLVITETRKPSKGSAWGSDIADIAGSGRIVYAASGILQIVHFTDRDMIDLAEIHGLPIHKGNESAYLRRFKSSFRARASALCYINGTKARDGMRKFDAIYEYFYEQNRFVKATYGSLGQSIKDIVDLLPVEEKKEKNKPS